MAQPVWVAALPSDDDEDGAPTREVETELYVVEDDDVQILNVRKHEHSGANSAAFDTSGVAQYLCASSSSLVDTGNLDQTGKSAVKFDRETFQFAAKKAPMQKNIEMSRKARKKMERRLRAGHFDGRGEGSTDLQLYNTFVEQGRGQGIAAGAPASQWNELSIRGGDIAPPLREQGILAGGPASQLRGTGSHAREQEILGGPPSQPKGLATHIREHLTRAAESALPSREQGILAGGPASQLRGLASHIREHGILGGGLPSQLRGQTMNGGGPVPQLIGHGFPGLPTVQWGELSSHGEELFSAPTGSRRMPTVHAYDNGKIVDQEQSFIATAFRIHEIPQRGPAPPSPRLVRILAGNTRNDWWNSLLGSAGTEFSQLHCDILRFCAAHELTPEQMQDRRDALKYVECAVCEIWPTAEVQLFGSTATGLALPWSDIDVVVLSAHRPGQSWLSPPTSSWLTSLGRNLKSHGQCQSLQKIPHAKVPLLKVVFKSGLSCDISMGASNGPRGVPVIRQFMQQFEALRPLCLVLKFFLGQLNLNELYTGGLGSFCLINMVVSHLQKLGVHGSGHDLGTLLLSFFIHYGMLHDYRTDVVSTRTDFHISKQDKGWVNFREPELLAVEDPLDPTMDIAKGSYKIQEVRMKFLEAQRLLITHWHQGNILSYLMDTTGNPNCRPKPGVENSQVVEHKKRKSHRGGEREDGEQVQVWKKQKMHSRQSQQGSDLVGRTSKKFKNKQKKKQTRKAQNIGPDPWDSHFSPRKYSKKGSNKRAKW